MTGRDNKPAWHARSEASSYRRDEPVSNVVVVHEINRIVLSRRALNVQNG
jgi:hypothetical protein